MGNDTVYGIREIQIDGHKMAAIEVNRGVNNIPVIFIHGISASVMAWPLVQIPFFQAYPWYSISLPGHYPAIFPEGFKPEDLTAELVADLTARTITELVGDQPCILVGHSTGGFAVLATAAYRPKNILAVCSMAGFVRGEWMSVLGYLQWLVRRGRLGRWFFDVNLSALKWGRNLFKPRQNMEKQDNDYFQKLDTKAMQAWFLQMPMVDISDMLEKIRVPVLVIYGDKDPLVSPEQSRKVFEKVKGCEKVEFKGVGHIPNTENPTLYEKTITGWVTRFLGKI